MRRGAFICGCAGKALTAAETDFLRRTRPAGFILFRRNIENKKQVSDLCEQYRNAVGDVNALVLVDQEGGRVQRFAPPVWRSRPSARAIAALGAAAEEAAELAGRLIAADLREVGVTMDCAPVLDVPAADGHEVIGDRAFGVDPEAVARLGGAFARGLLAGGVIPVVKHVPGHGRARADSHRELPRVAASREELERRDFAPFKALAHLPAAMTAHVVYEALDAGRPGTVSPAAIRDIVRGAIGFEGLLMTDDLSMHALEGPMVERARAARAAGVDLALHCDGTLADAEAVAEGAGPLDVRGAARIAAALAAAKSAEMSAAARAFDREAGEARLRDLLAAFAA